jgi:hypothetical protein
MKIMSQHCQDLADRFDHALKVTCHGEESTSTDNVKTESREILYPELMSRDALIAHLRNVSSFQLLDFTLKKKVSASSGSGQHSRPGRPIEGQIGRLGNKTNSSQTQARLLRDPNASRGSHDGYAREKNRSERHGLLHLSTAEAK